MNATRQALTSAVIATFLLFFFAAGLRYQVFHREGTIFRSTAHHVHPDFSRYIHSRTLSANEFPIDDPHRRVIIVGDIHGMNQAIHALLAKLTYNPTTDTLIHTGDIIVKSPSFSSSLSVLSFFSTHNITGVRGNHDQIVIDWRSWINWLHSKRDGTSWLEEMEVRWGKAEKHGDELEVWIAKEKKKDNGKRKWWETVPDGWKIFSEHYMIARSMSEREYEYLLSLPLVLHIPSAHTFIVHAGLLSSDPTRSSTHPRQPLSHVPIMPSILNPDQTSTQNDTILVLRRLQELSILNDIPQNINPWVTLNMRSLAKNGDVTKQNHGKPWSQLWNAEMGRCGGFHSDSTTHSLQSESLPCLPSTVVYGHAAARGLDVKRWTVGLDSGCVYGKLLTVLVLGPPSHLPQVDNANEAIILFGDDGHGRLISVKC